MKSSRHNIILEVIKQNDVGTQDELTAALCNAGISVTQATVSRDIKELGLVKMQVGVGRSKYVRGDMKSADSRMVHILRDIVYSVVSAGNLVIINTMAGSANTAAEVVDKLMLDGVLGSIAGDDTVFLAAGDEKIARAICEKLKLYIKGV